MIVVDASLVFQYLSRTERAGTMEARQVQEGFLIHAPQMLPVELLSALRGRAAVIDSPAFAHCP